MALSQQRSAIMPLFCVAIVLAVTVVADDEKPLGSDPFPNDPANPFGVGARVDAADPFGGARPKKEFTKKARWGHLSAPMRQRLESRINDTAKIAQEITEGFDDERVFEGSLALLHYTSYDTNERFGDIMQIVERFANHRWKMLPDESAKDFAARMEQADLKREKTKLYDAPARGFEEIAREPWPLKWREKREYWLNVAAALIRSTTSPKPSRLWKLAIAQDESNADFYRACYFGIARTDFVPPEEFDFSIVQTMLERAKGPGDGLATRARILDAMIGAGINFSHQRRVALREQLIKDLRAVKLNIGDSETDGLGTSLARLCKISHPKLERQSR